MEATRLHKLRSGVRNTSSSSASQGSEKEEKNEEVPRDRFNLVYIGFFMAGAGFLTPWGSYIGAIDYFFYYYLTEFPTVSVVIPMMYLTVSFLSASLNVVLVRKFEVHSKITFGYIMFVLSLLTIPLLDFGLHNCAIPTGIGFYVTLLSICVVGLGSGVQQSSYYGLSSMLPRKYTQAVMTGESVAGVLESSLRILTKASVRSERVGAIIFFSLSLCFILVCVGCHWYIRGHKLVIFFMKRCKGMGVNVTPEMVDGENEMDISLADRNSDRQHLLNGNEDSTDMDVSDGEGGMLGRKVNGNGVPFDNEEDLPKDQDGTLESKFHILWLKTLAYLKLCWVVVVQIWPLMGAIFLNYYITLLVFPGLISEVQDCRLGSWTPVLLIATFNVMDFIAKWLTLIRIRWSPKQLLIYSVGRVVFIPLIVLCISPSPTHPVLEGNVVVWAVLFMILLGLSNGYFGSLPLINLSSEVKKEEDRELAGTIMTSTLLVGLLIGAACAYALTPLTTLTQHTQCSNDTMEFFQLCNHGNGSIT